MFDSITAIRTIPNAAAVADQALRKARVQAHISCIFASTCVPGHTLEEAVASGGITRAEADQAARMHGAESLDDLVAMENERMEIILDGWPE